MGETNLDNFVLVGTIGITKADKKRDSVCSRLTVFPASSLIFQIDGGVL